MNRRDQRDYALYKGEEIMCIGTIDEIAKAQGIDRQTVKFYKTPGYLKRVEKRKTSNSSMLLIEIVEDEEEGEIQ